MELLERGHFFQCLIEQAYVQAEDLFIQMNGITEFGGYIYVHIYILSKITIKCVIIIHKQGSGRILVHFSLKISFEISNKDKAD